MRTAAVLSLLPAIVAPAPKPPSFALEGRSYSVIRAESKVALLDGSGLPIVIVPMEGGMDVVVFLKPIEDPLPDTDGHAFEANGEAYAWKRIDGLIVVIYNCNGHPLMAVIRHLRTIQTS